LYQRPYRTIDKRICHIEAMWLYMGLVVLGIVLAFSNWVSILPQIDCRAPGHAMRCEAPWPNCFPCKRQSSPCLLHLDVAIFQSCIATVHPRTLQNPMQGKVGLEMKVPSVGLIHRLSARLRWRSFPISVWMLSGIRYVLANCRTVVYSCWSCSEIRLRVIICGCCVLCAMCA